MRVPVDLSMEAQLSLELRMPWDGYSPRGLTKGANVFRLPPRGREPVDPECSNVDQLELFPEGTSFSLEV